MCNYGVDLGCVRFSWKQILELLLHPCVCLAPTENMVKWKINYSLTVKSPTSVIKPILPSFYLQMNYRTQREREHEHTHKTQITPHLSQAQASPAKLRSRRPTAQIMHRPNTQDPQTPVHPDPNPPLLHHRSTFPITSHALTSSDLDNHP